MIREVLEFLSRQVSALGGCRAARRDRKQSSRGIVLIITLWVVMIVATIALTYALQARTEVHMVGFAADAMQAYYLAKSGLSRAMVLLREDTLKDQDVLDTEDLIRLDDDDTGFLYDGHNEEWFRGSKARYDQTEFEERCYQDVSMHADRRDRSPLGTYTVRVVDESSKINLNFTATTKELLRELLMVTGVEVEDADLIAAEIIDWRDEDDSPSEVSEDDDRLGEADTESAFYNPDQNERDLEDYGPEYVCKNGPFGCIEELLLLRDMDPLIFFGEDANRNGEIDENEDDGDETWPPDNADGDLLLGLRDYVTIDSAGAVNLNTAGGVVLQALFGFMERGEDDVDRERGRMRSSERRRAEDLAEELIDFRDGPDRDPGTRDDRVFRTLDGSDPEGHQISDIHNFDEEYVQSLGNLIGVSSDTFTIVSTGDVRGVKRTVRATVFRDFVEEVEMERHKKKRVRESSSDEEVDDPRDDDQGRVYIKRYSEEGT